MRTRLARRARWVLLAGMAVAVLAAVAVAVPLALRRPRWPGLPAGSVVTLATGLPDGSNYSLRWIMDPDFTVGVSAAADGLTFRVVVVRAGQVTTLRELPSIAGPAFDPFVWSQGSVYWVERTITADGTELAQLWAAEVGQRVGPPRLVVEDMGAVQLTSYAHDLVVADGTASWTVVVDDRTLVRSMPVTGGAVAETGFAGRWRQIDRRWLISVQAPTTLLDPATGQRVTVPGAETGMTECSSRWCRVTIPGPDGTYRLEVLAPDGSQRATIAGSRNLFAAVDPWALDRYELFSEFGGDLPRDYRFLLLYDRADGSTRLVERDTGGLVTVRAGWAWWLAGQPGRAVWHLLDLDALAGADRTA